MIELIIILAVAVLLYAVMARGSRRPARKRSGRVNGYDRELVATRWTGIEAQAAANGGAKGAISEADKLFDYVLKGMGFAGETMAERLKRAESRLSNKNGVWAAHKLRNALAHEIGFEVAVSHAREALTDYHRGLQDLGAL